MAIDADVARIGIVEAQEQLGDSGLARPALSDEGERLSGLYTEGDVLQRRPLGAWEVKGDRVELQRASDAVQLEGILSFRHRGALVQELDYPLGSGGGFVDGVQEAAETLNRGVQLAQVDYKDQEAADGEPPLREFPHPRAYDREHPG